MFESEGEPGQAVTHDDVVGVHQLAISKSYGAQNWRDAPDFLVEEWLQPLQDLYHRSINSLSFEKSIKLARLIEHNKDAFAKGPIDLGQTSVVTHHIDTGTSKPIKQQPRRTPKAFEGEEEKILREQLQAGVIQESSSPWASPIVYIRKKNCSIRPCVDYRKLNECTQKCAYLIPETSSCLDCLNGAKYMSSLDL